MASARPFLRPAGALLSGLLLAMCYAPFGASWLIWVALLPLMAAIWLGEPIRARAGFGFGYLAGVVFFLINVNWLHHVTTLGAVLLAFYLALYPALWGAFAASVGRCQNNSRIGARVHAIVFCAAAWTASEWLRGTVLTGFGWNGVGVALGSSRLAQAADVIGVTGLSSVIVSVEVAAFHLARRVISLRRMAVLGKAPEAGGLAVLLAALAVYGDWRVRSFGRNASGTSLAVGLVQPHIAQEIKSNADYLSSIARTLSDLSDAALRHGPLDLLVWPESALPATFFDPDVQSFLDDILRRGDFTLITGIDEQELETYYNSIAVVRGDLATARLHRKVHLVPFGEYLPLRAIFGYFAFITDQLPGDFDAGTLIEPVPLPGRQVSVIPLVCFEDTIGSLARRFVRPQPQLLINVTNDAWFLDSEGPDQHLHNALFRCLELRRPMLRAANTGVTCVIDPAGRITSRLSRLEEGVLTATVAIPHRNELTVFARVGDAFSMAMLIVATGAALFFLGRRMKHNTPWRPSNAGLIPRVENSDSDGKVR
jgi:apolipoprotein N-acyltransferase